METVMMGLQAGDQHQLFYLFNLEKRIPADHLLRFVLAINGRKKNRVHPVKIHSLFLQ
jgi:hypothetical protein